MDTKDLNSCVFWTTETTDIDDIKRGGAFRRMLYLLIEKWQDFTEDIELSTDEPRPNEKYAGCGVDYIKFAVNNLDKISEIFVRETRDFSTKYGEITGLAGTLYAGIVLLEQYYNQRFDKLRQKVDELLNEAKRTFILTKDNIVEMLHQYLYNNLHRLAHVAQVRDGEGGYKYETKYKPSSKEMLGEYDETTKTYYISINGFKTIAKELEKERNLLVNALVKAGVIERRTENGKEKETTIPYYSKITKEKIRVYKLKFPDLPDKPSSDTSDDTPPRDNPPDSPITPEPEHMDTPSDETSSINTVDKSPIDEPSDSEVDFFTETPFERQQREKHARQQTKQQLNNQHIEKKLHDTQPLGTNNNESEPIIDEIGDDEIKEETESTEQTINEKGSAGMNIKPIKQEQFGSENKESKEDKPKDRIVIDENTLDIYDVKPREEILKYEIPKRNIKPFSELIVGSLDIESTGLNIYNDQILAIAFNIYKNGELQHKYRYYVNQYNYNDTKMVSAFLNDLVKSKIDVLTGWNLYDFDLKMIKEKDKENRIDFTDPVNISGAMLSNKQLQGYCIKINGKLIEVIDAMHLTIKYDNIARDIPAQNYDLKSVAKHFGISDKNRVVLGADQILKAFEENDIELLEKYHGEDVREAYEIFKKLAPPYYYIKSIVPFNISFFKAFRSSTASIWEKTLEYYYDSKDPNYKNTITADEKKDYEGALVIVNKGLYRNVYKIDVASLYPNIMLNYHIHSRKDKDKIALAILNEYTNLRLQLKKRAKEGDKEADLVQSALKILINSLYGFYGTGGYLFNDMLASAKITAYGRKILKFMIDYVETNGGIIIECDTDGIFFSAKNGEEIYEGLRKKLNEEINFDIELEYRDCIMFASDKKNYILIEPNGKIVKKGSKYAGRDKNKLQTEFVVEYVKRYIEDPAKADEYEKEMWDRIFHREAFGWLKITRKVGKGDKSILKEARLKGKNITYGSIVTYVYSNFKGKKYIFEGENESLYDVNYYLNEFGKLMKEIKEVINVTATNTLNDTNNRLPASQRQSEKFEYDPDIGLIE
ncbi:MAG: DNA polymerase domain-containing protein [Candidatus Nanopusillus acidilobi]